MEQSKTKLSGFGLRSTSFGVVAAVWSDCMGSPKTRRIFLSKPGLSAKQSVRKLFPDASDSSCPEIDTLLDNVESFLCGEDIVFSLDAVRLDLCTSFQQKVLSAQHAIPRGAVSTYGLIAKYLNNPYGARAVGTALAENPFPFVIPCHRTIRYNGALGGFGGGQDMKRKLLEMEGIRFLQSGQVAVQSFFYRDEVVKK
jgi:methylated-DNA-[protein]-cysteine S-methyltransferase